MAVRSSDWTGLALANGRYVITAKLGEGGMGAVYRARDQNIDADVVIKVPLRSMLDDPEFSRRFKDEVRSLVKLSHPHIVKVSDVGEWDEVPFAVMQFLTGGNLEGRLVPDPDGRAAASDPRAVPRWLTAMADALDYVHRQGYVHRDVKPGNILFDGQGHAFLGDFGVVKVMASTTSARSARKSMTGAGMVVGTPEYMAPELIMGEPFDGRVDQYALAVTAYELLCGRRPFEDEVKTRVLVLQTTQPPPSPADFCSWIPGRLAKALLQGLAKDPADRYPNCAAMAGAVRDAIEAWIAEGADRVRVACHSCGKALTLSAFDLAGIQRSGRPITCTNCKATIYLSGAGAVVIDARTPAHGTARGGTMILSPQSDPGAPAPGDGPPPTPPRATVRLSTPLTPGAATLVERPGVHAAAPGRSSRTLVEPPGLPAGRAGQSAESSGPEVKPRDRRGSRIEGSKAGNSRVPLIFAAIGLALAALVGAFSLTRPVPDRVTKADAAVPTRTGATSPGVPGVESVATTTDAVGTPTTAENQGPAGLAKLEPPARRHDPVTVASPEGPPVPVVPREEEALLAIGDRVEPRVEPSFPGPREDDAAGVELLMRKLDSARASVPLKKILDNPRAYANQVLVVLETYSIGDVATRRPDGSISLPVIRSDLHLQNDGTVQTRREDSVDLDLDPSLSRQLVRLGKIAGPVDSPPTTYRWDEHPAILTVEVAGRAQGGRGDSACRIVRCEFCTRLEPYQAKVGYKAKLRIEYETLTVTPGGDETGKGKPEEWSRIDRLGHIVNQYTNTFDSMAKQMSQAKWLQFRAQVNSIVSEGIQGAAASAAAEQARRREMTQPKQLYP